MRALLVINPRATTTTPRARDVLVSALSDAVKLDVEVTRARNHATELAAQATADGFDAVIALGGDGTVNEVVNGVLSAGPRLASELPAVGVVAGGSSNVLARILGLPVDTVEAAGAVLDLLRRESSRTVGLGRAANRWFTFNAGLGWDAGTVERVEKARAKGKNASDALYVRSAVAEYFATPHRSSPMQAHLPGEEPIGLGLAFVTNTSPWTYLGPRPVVVTPEASFETGLDLFGVQRLRLAPVLRTALSMVRGNPKGRKLVLRHDLPELTLTAEKAQPLQVDGDYVGHHTSVTLTAHPAAIRLLADPAPSR